MELETLEIILIDIHALNIAFENRRLDLGRLDSTLRLQLNATNLELTHLGNPKKLQRNRELGDEYPDQESSPLRTSTTERVSSPATSESSSEETHLDLGMSTETDDSLVSFATLLSSRREGTPLIMGATNEEDKR